MLLKELTNEQFNNFTEEFKDKSIYQTVEYAFVMNKQNFDSLFLGMFDSNNTIVAATLLLIEKRFGFKYAYAPRGFLIDYNNKEYLNEFTKLIKKYLGKQDIIAVKITPMIYKEKRNNENIVTVTNENFEETLKFLKSKKYYHLGFNNSFEALKPRFEAIIPLNKNYIEIFNKLPKTLKTKIRSAAKSGIVIHKGNKDNLGYLYLQTKKKYPRDLEYFNDCYDFFNKNKKAEFYYAKIDTSIFLNKARYEYQKCLEQNNKINEELLENKQSNVKFIQKKMEYDKLLNEVKNDLITATALNRQFPNGIVIASVIIIKHANTATLLIDGYDTNYKKFNGKHLLIWKLIQTFASEGITEFNLGGINNPNDMNEKYKGLTEFKLSFGAESVEYIGDLELITNTPLYFMYRNSAPIRKILKK